MKTYYRFTKNGRAYCESGNNRFDAQLKAEFRWNIKLSSALYEEIYNTRVIRKGIVY